MIDPFIWSSEEDLIGVLISLGQFNSHSSSNRGRKVRSVLFTSIVDITNPSCVFVTKRNNNQWW